MPDDRRALTDPARVLAAILDSDRDAIIAKNLDGRIVVWNQGAERMYGYTANEMVGEPVATIIPAEQQDEQLNIMRRIADGKRVEPYETIRITKDGRRLNVRLVVTPLTDESGRPVGAVAIGRDMTSLHRAGTALGRSEARWQAIVESAVDGIIVIDGRGTIESFNPAAERLFGHEAGDVIGKNVSMLMPSPDTERHDGYLARYLETGERRIIGIGREVTGLRRDGSTFPLHLSVAQVAIDGEIKFTGIVRDLTERVAMETRLQEESGLARIGELAAVLAHEVKNPLAAVSGAIQMIAHRVALDTEEREIIQEILLRINGLSDLMGDLLLYARPPKPSLMPLDPLAILESQLSLFKADPAWHQIEVVVEGSARPVQADPELLKIAVQNLLLNAVQSMHGKGTVRIAVRDRDGLIDVDISDAGPGISADVRARMFTPFFTTKARGTGLGLPTTRRILQSLGGDVKVLRSDATGTTMRLTVPQAWRDS